MKSLTEKLEAAKARDTANKALAGEAIRKLRGYLASGIDGLRQQAYDRAEVLGIRTGGLSRDQAGAQHLLSHMILCGW